MGTVDMDLGYADYFGTTPNTGYETLLHDCMKDDPTLFHRADTVEVGWTMVAPVSMSGRRCRRELSPIISDDTGDPKEPTNC